MTSPTRELLEALISKPSVTPDDQGCQSLIADRLTAIGFNATHMRFEDVDNLWITHGQGEPLLVFAGHTDVVPPGPLEEWDTDPFTPTEKDGYLYGRGAADMKSGLSAMIVACERFVQSNPEHKGTVALLITSNEEGDPTHGTQKVVDRLSKEGVRIDYCVVGEASSTTELGDTIKHGRRGSLSVELTVHGKQGHVAYPLEADNAIHKSLAALAELSQTTWDEGDADFPPTTFQLSNVHSGTGANNVIPGVLEASFNLRFSPAVTADELRAKIESIFSSHSVTPEIQWQLSGNSFLTPPGKLREVSAEAVKDVTGITPSFSTAGGTSDGRFIAPTGAEVVEIGPCNATIHKVNERIDINELEPLTDIYESVCLRLLG